MGDAQTRADRVCFRGAARIRHKLAAVVATAVIVSMILTGTAMAKKPKPITTALPRVVVLTPEQITAAMLAPSDAPIGWATVSVPISAPNATSGFCNAPNVSARAQTNDAVAQHSVGFAQDPVGGPFIVQLFFEFPTETDAKAFLDSTSQALATCTTWTNVSPTGVNRSSVTSPLSFPQGNAEQIVAVRTTLTPKTQSGDGPATIQDTIYLRIDNHATVITHSGSFPSISDLSIYVGIASNKLGTAMKTATVTTKTTTTKRKRR
jgi:hypothetical protein